MSRLVHSLPGHMRALQMSRHRVFAFVEGRDPDPYFYGKVARAVFGDENPGFQIRRSEEIGGLGSGGKLALLDFFRYLEANGGAGGEFKDKKWFSVFYIDKDIDDLLGKTVESLHIVYTRYFDVESHVYEAGNLREGAAAATGVDLGETPTGLADSNAWRARAAGYWKGWVILCLLVARLQVSCACGYRLKSQINDPANSPETEQSFTNAVNQISEACGLPADEFQDCLAEARADVERCYAEGRFDLVFKGKWYSAILYAELHQHLAGKPANLTALEVRLTLAIAQTVDVDQPWADHFKAPLGTLAASYLN